MPAGNTPRALLPLIDPDQFSADVTHNEALILADALIGGAIFVWDDTLTAPPGSPVNGDAYIVATGGTGAWAAQDAHIAIYNEGWHFFVIQYGWMIHNANGGTLKIWRANNTWGLVTVT